MDVEHSGELRAGGYARPLKYTVDKSLRDKEWPFRYVFDQGELRCSEAASHTDRTCYVPRGIQTTLARENPSFVYLDVGCWADDPDGTRFGHRDFGLVCGQHVYLCQFVGGPCLPITSVPVVRELFEGLAGFGCGVRVVGYACARNLAPATSQDTELYLLLGDLHLPPAYWFYGEAPSSGAPEVAWPDWVDAAPAVIRNRTRLLRYYRLGTQDLARGRWQQIKSPVPPHVDIFGIAGRDLVRFLDALASLPATVRRRLHFIQTGDMFELWMGREYQLVPGADGVPSWRTADSPDRVADWCLEVMVQNAPVISAFNQLEGSGLAEVCYLSGNHDGYLRKPEVPVQLGLPVRQPSYRGLHDDLLAEHGHRFDDSNLDNVDASRRLSGPALTNRVFKDPNKRSLESFCRELLGYANPKMRDIHLLGATLTFLQERFEQKKKPFAIYAMAHTHAPMLIRFDIRAGYIMKDHEEATNGVTLP